MSKARAKYMTGIRHLNEAKQAANRLGYPVDLISAYFIGKYTKPVQSVVRVANETELIRHFSFVKSASATEEVGIFKI